MNSYAEAVKRIEARRDAPARAESFARFCRAFDELAIPVPAERVIVVAGTNGKGSVCKTLETLLSAAGESVGVCTSPHLIKTTERIRSQGRDLSEAEFVAAFDRVQSLADRHGLSHFEILTLMAAIVFFTDEIRPRVDRAILEVGVGGRLDPVNAFPHKRAVLTKLGLDHRETLGATLAEIAMHKLGAVPNDGVVIHAPFSSDIHPVLELVQQSSRATWREVASFPWRVDTSPSEPRFFLQTSWGEAELSLAGPRAAENTSIALAAFESCGYDPAPRLGALSHVDWPGRMETWSGGNLPCPLHLSGDHNPQGVQSLVELLSFYRRDRLHLIIGIGLRKDMDGMMVPYSSIPGADLYLTCTSFRPAPLESYGAWLRKAKGSDEDPLRLLDRVRSEATAGDRIVLSGSLYLVGQIRSALIGGRFGDVLRYPFMKRT